MPYINCPNCDKVTPVIPPKYLCKHCNYPLSKNVKQAQKDNKDVKVNFGSNPNSEGTKSDGSAPPTRDSNPVDIKIDSSSINPQGGEAFTPPQMSTKLLLQNFWVIQ